MKHFLYGYGKQSAINRQLKVFFPIKAIILLWLLFFIYACSTMNSKDYSTMSNNKLLEKGNEAPDFTANTYNGSSISLAKLQKVGPVVLIFIRGFS